MINYEINNFYISVCSCIFIFLYMCTFICRISIITRSCFIMFELRKLNILQIISAGFPQCKRGVSARFGCGNCTYTNFPIRIRILQQFGIAKFQQEVKVDGNRLVFGTPQDSETRTLRPETMRKPYVFLSFSIISAEFQQCSNDIFHPVYEIYYFYIQVFHFLLQQLLNMRLLLLAPNLKYILYLNGWEAMCTKFICRFLYNARSCFIQFQLRKLYTKQVVSAT